MKLFLDKNKFSRYYSAIRYIESLVNITGSYQKTNLRSHPQPEMFLERMQGFLDNLVNPEKGFKYIHITGTAGKGSVANMVHNQLMETGKRVGLFTSPFTVSTIEKIQVGDKYIDPLVFADITDEIKPKIDEMIKCSKHGAPSYFEIMLAIALIYFKKEGCEYVILEVGLGGRYDATNIIKRPLITAITNIGLDHTKTLGSRRSLIASDKAGIIKKGSRFFTTEEDENILRIFKDTCQKVGAGFNSIPVDGLDYDERNRLLAGNICVGLGILKSATEINASPDLPARFEIVEKHPFVIIDGAHNPLKLESTIQNLSELKFKKLVLVVAISADKDWKTMLGMIATRADRIFVTRFTVPGRQSVGPSLLLKEVEKIVGWSKNIFLYSDPVQAFRVAKAGLLQDEALLIVGSFYLAGNIRSLYCPESKILQKRSSCGGNS